MKNSYNNIHQNKVEILAPAGTYESFQAAVHAGADAIYLGGDMFGARAFAGNFNQEELVRAIHTAHLHDKKIYLTVNTLLRNDEISKVVDYIQPYYEEGLDAVIVQDFGVFQIIKKAFPDLDIHASTQMTITGALGAQLLKDMGASRIVTARELSLAEIKDIHNQVEIEIESFVHGALCYSYSGQCLLSSMIGGRSGNRGRCAQPCRLTYSCNGGEENHLLSPKDMCTVEAIPDMLEAGIYSLKIEGRMKSPEYTAGVVQVYRKYVDKYLEKGRDGFHVDSQDMKNLMDIYNRGGFCKGYFYQHNDTNMMTFHRPNHQGIIVGTVKNAMLVLSEEVHGGDVIELPGNHEFTVQVSTKVGSTMKIPFMKGFKPENGMAAYRTRNKSLLENIHKEYVEKEIKRSVNIYASFKKGKEAQLTVISGEHSATVSGDIISESQNRPASREDVEKQLLKMGGTAFVCEEITLELDEQIFLPVKLINQLRRDALLKLEESIYGAGKRVMNTGKNPLYFGNTENESPLLKKTETVIQVMNEDQLQVVLEEYGNIPDRIYLSTETEGIDGAIRMCRQCKEYQVKAYLVLPYIFRKKTAVWYEGKLDELKEAGFSGVVLRSPEELQFIKKYKLEEIFAGNIIADYNMYTYNNQAIAQYEKLGVNEFTLSEEMNGKQLESLLKSSPNIEFEKLVYGHLPLMISAGCTLKYTSGKKSPCNHPSVYYITDRKKKDMPVINSCPYCYNMILNYAPLYLMDKTEELSQMGINKMRILFTIEDENKVREVLQLYGKAANGPTGTFTRGHYNRGVE